MTFKKELEVMTGKKCIHQYNRNKGPELDAQLVAENIASQLEKSGFLQKGHETAIQRTMRAEPRVSKQWWLEGWEKAEIARSERYSEGTIPLQTLAADIVRSLQRRIPPTEKSG